MIDIVFVKQAVTLKFAKKDKKTPVPATTAGTRVSSRYHPDYSKNTVILASVTVM